MGTNQEIADHYAYQALQLHQKQSHMPPSVTGMSGIATAHAVLALLDYLQQDDNHEQARDNELADLRRIARNYESTVITLRGELEAARNALRVREAITTAEMQTVNWGPPDG